MMSINISAGEVAKSFTVDILNDNIVDCIETFNVRIMSVESCGFTIGSNNTSVVMIRDDDSKLYITTCATYVAML